jgi:hypothetical protein
MSLVGGITAIRLGLVPMAIACAACLLLFPSGAVLAAGLLVARFRLERIRLECEREMSQSLDSSVNQK